MTQLTWTHEENPQWDSSGTVARSWYASIRNYHARIDEFKAGEGGGFAYSVNDSAGNFLQDAENVAAVCRETAELAVLRILNAALMPVGTASDLADRMNAYWADDGNDYWNDVVLREFRQWVDEAATGAADISDMGDIIVLVDGSTVCYDEARREWVVGPIR